MNGPFPRRPNFGPRPPELAGGDQSIKLTEEDERILDEAAARRWRERQERAAAQREEEPLSASVAPVEPVRA